MNILKPLAVLLLIAGPALAQDHAGHGAHDTMGGHMAAMDKMMQSMAGMTTTGNPDADFLLMMIPHHQSAVDMAQIELDQGKDPQTRELAQKIIDAQKAEIAQMQAMLQRMGVAASE